MTARDDAARRYSEDRRRGFVVRSHTKFKRPDGRDHSHTTWWYGPNHGWGTTFGGLDYSVEVFPSRQAANAAIAQYRGHSAHRLVIDTLAEARRIRDAVAAERARRQEAAPSQQPATTTP